MLEGTTRWGKLFCSGTQPGAKGMPPAFSRNSIAEGLTALGIFPFMGIADRHENVKICRMTEMLGEKGLLCS